MQCKVNCQSMHFRNFTAVSSDDGNVAEMDVSKMLPLYEQSDDGNIDKHVQRVTNVKFDTLGPAVVTENGKLRFFEDWEGKTEQEKEDILKIIIPRNQQRIEALQTAQQRDDTSNTTNVHTSKQTVSSSKDLNE